MLDITNATRNEFTVMGVKVEGVTIVCDTDRARRRFWHVINQADFCTCHFKLEGQPQGYAEGYASLHFVTEDEYITVNGFDVLLVETGVQFAPCDYKGYDEEWTMEERWVELLPVIRWFFALPESESMIEREW